MSKKYWPFSAILRVHFVQVHPKQQSIGEGQKFVQIANKSIIGRNSVKNGLKIAIWHIPATEFHCQPFSAKLLQL